MFLFTAKAPISMLSHDYAIATRKHGEREEHEEIEEIIKRLHAGEYAQLDRCEELIEHLFATIKENIAHYAKLEEEERLIILEDVTHEFFRRHIFDHLDDEIVHEIRTNFDAQVKKNIHEFMKEKKRRPHGKKPVNTYFRKLFGENKHLNRNELRAAREHLKLHKEEKETQEHLYNMLMVLTRPKALDTAHEKPHIERLTRAIDHFIQVTAQEFHTLYDLEQEAHEEADLLHELTWLLKQKKIPKEHKKKIKKLISKIKKYFKKDVQKYKRELKKATT